MRWNLEWIYPKSRKHFKESTITARDARNLQKSVEVIKEKGLEIQHEKEFNLLMKGIKEESKLGRDKLYLKAHEGIFKKSIDTLRDLGYFVYYIDSGYFWVISWHPKDKFMEEHFGKS